MNTTILQSLITRYPQLHACTNDLVAAHNMIAESYRNKNKLLVCGNGGSAADALHIVGELMKSFVKKRAITTAIQTSLHELFPNDANLLASSLEGALPAIALVENSSLATAYMNDKEPLLVFAQQVYGLGQGGDILLCITTSGNSQNVIYAAQVAKAVGMQVIALTGGHGGKMKNIADVSIVVPEQETYKIQELHLPIYHALCLALEDTFFA